MAKAKRPTRETILDAAELLFARRGFYGVSLRDITNAAGVDVALVSYYFGSKMDLYAEVLARRSAVINEARAEMLDEARRDAHPGPPSLEAVINAFTYPLLNRSERGSKGWKAYFAIIAQVNNSPELGHLLMSRTFDPVVQRFIEALRECLPDADLRDLYWAHHFLSGALSLTFAETGRIDKLSGGLCRSKDIDGIHERLVPYFAAGLRALCERRKAAATPTAGRRAKARRRPAARARSAP